MKNFMREEKKKEKMEKINLIPYSKYIYNDNGTFIMLLKRKA